MVKRVLFAETKPTVGQYDCIIVDECHRGYILDKELSDTEIKFRNEDDYISKYRRVLEYFDAVKIGLTATPALHTCDIFGNPIFSYTYREAVVDGYLIDHEPAIKIKTKHNIHGISYKTGEPIDCFNPEKQQIKQVRLADNLNFDVTKINRTVIAKSFNQLICQFLAKNIDPDSEGKTLIFCVNNTHADEVVEQLKIAFKAEYDKCEDASISKITGSVDKPQEKIRQYKNERLPNIAVTVDLLTTGIDVPEICNLVFLRPVTSRILYEQMKGRATRLCIKINKETFRIFDAVSLYDNLEPLTNMQPVVVKASISFTDLISELINPEIKDQTHKQQVVEQIIAKLQRKKISIEKDSDLKNEFTNATNNLTPDNLIQQLKKPLTDVISWFTNHPNVATILDIKQSSRPIPIFISNKQDVVIEIGADYGEAVTPEDYLTEFNNFIKNNINHVVALQTLVKQPANITRKQIKEIILLLDQQSFTEINLRHALKLKNKKDIAARIVGYVRQAAVGDALVPWEQRVDSAMAIILQQHSWNAKQKNILQSIATLLKRRMALDEESINASNLKDQYGPYKIINTKVFNNQLPQILASINTAIWQNTNQQHAYQP
jgi:type I restriction enzyme R subunit